MITAGSLEGRKKRRREIPATGTLLNTRQSASSASSGQLRDSRSDHRADGTRLDGHIYAQSMQNVPVSTVPGSDQQRSFSMDDGIEGTHSSQSQNVVSCQHYHVLQPPPDFPYPRSDTFQSYFDAGLSANPRQGPLQTDEHVDQYRASFERQSDNGLLMMTSPRWNVPTETRAPRAEPMVSPLTQSEPDSYRNNEYPDEVAEGQIHRENGISLRCGRRSVDRSAPDYDIDFDKSFKLAQLYGYGVDKFNSDFATNSVVDTEYTHPAGVSEKYYQSSLASSSESDSMNSAGPRTERYYSVDSLESSSSQLRDPNTTSQKHTYYPPPAPRRGNSPTHYEDSRESHDSQYSGQQENTANTAFERRVDVWQDGQPGLINHRTLLLDTQCRKSNWVSGSIITDLDLWGSVKGMAEPMEFSCANGGIMSATTKIKLNFKEYGGVMTYAAMFFVAPVDVPFEILLGADDIIRCNMLWSRPPPVRILGLIPRDQTKYDRIQEPIRKVEQNSKAEEHERKRREKEAKKQKEKEKERQRQDSGKRQDSSQQSKGRGYK